MNAQYREGFSAWRANKQKVSPYARSTQAHHQWCAGWNDADMTRYFVHDVKRLVRTESEPAFNPPEGWRQVTLEEWEEWEEFRKETKAKKVRK